MTHAYFVNLSPKWVKYALENEDWIQEMNEEIEQIEKNNTWTLVPRPKDKNVIGTKWGFRNKLNENGEVKRNKERLVYKGYDQEGVDYGETFAPVERLKGVRTLLAYLSYKSFKVYQIDVKFVFSLYHFLSDENLQLRLFVHVEC